MAFRSGSFSILLSVLLLGVLPAQGQEAVAADAQSASISESDQAASMPSASTAAAGRQRAQLEALEDQRQSLEMALLAEQSRVRALELAQQERNRRLQWIRAVLLLALGLVIGALLLWRIGESRRRGRSAAATDPLTGLPGRQLMFDRLDTLLARLEPNRGCLAVVLVAVEDFASLRDRHGRTVADAALQSLAAALSDALRPGDMLSRVEEDSFLLVLPRTGAEGAAQVARRMGDLVAALPVRGEHATLALRASLGWAGTGAIRHSARSLYAAAQESLAANGPTVCSAGHERDESGSGRGGGLEVVKAEQSLPV